MQVFVAVADAGSLAGGGKALGLSPPVVTRVITALEQRLGVRLLNRTTRSLGLTEAGARFLESARQVLAALDEAERSAAGATEVPSGHLRVTAPLTFGRMHLMPVLAAFLRAQPRVSATLVTLDRVANLIEEGFDVAVRIAQLPESTLVARRIGEVTRVLVASPAYLDQQGVPHQPTDLKAHAVIAVPNLMPAGEWRFWADGKSQMVRLTPSLAVNDALAAIMAAERGEGLTTALSYMVAPQLRAGTLVTVLDPFTPPPVPVQLVHPQSRLVAAKVRAFMDFAGPKLTRILAAEARSPATG